MRLRIAVGALREIAVEARDDGVRTLVVVGLALPLADAGAAGVGHHGRARLAKRVQDAVALGRRADLRAARDDEQLCLRLQARIQRGARHGGRPGEVLVGGIGAGADQAHLHLVREMLPRLAVLHLAERAGRVRRVGTVDIRFELRQIDLQDLVIILLGMGHHGVVRAQLGAERGGHRGHFAAAGGHQVLGDVHAEGEDGTGGAHFGAHIADGSLAGAGEILRAGAEIFDDGVGAALDGQHPGELEDDVLGRSPALERAGQAHADQARHPELPGHPRHHIHRIGAAHADGQHTHTAGIGRMGVRPDHHAARERVVLQDDLMDDAGTRLPEPDAVAGCRRSEEIIDLLVGLEGVRQIRFGALSGANEMVAMDGCRHAHGVAARAHELQQGHLGRSVLHRHAVGTELAEILQPLQRPDVGGVVHVCVQDLLRQGKRPPQLTPDRGHSLSVALVKGFHGLQIKHTRIYY